MHSILKSLPTTEVKYLQKVCNRSKKALTGDNQSWNCTQYLVYCCNGLLIFSWINWNDLTLVSEWTLFPTVIPYMDMGLASKPLTQRNQRYPPTVVFSGWPRRWWCVKPWRTLHMTTRLISGPWESLWSSLLRSNRRTTSLTPWGCCWRSPSLSRRLWSSHTNGDPQKNKLEYIT